MFSLNKEKLIVMIVFLKLNFFFGPIVLGDTSIGPEKLLNRESIGRHTKKEIIMRNKNIDFDKMSHMKVIVGDSAVDCFFGYQNQQRLVLCY